MARMCVPPMPAKDSTFESECIDLIRHLESVHLVRAQLRLSAAERAWQTATDEIECLRASITIFREMKTNPDPLTATPRPNDGEDG